MSAKILNGRELAKKLLEDLSKEISAIKQKPTLATVRVGENKNAQLYANAIENLFKKLELGYVARVFPEKATVSEIVTEIKRLNKDPKISGMMMFLPLPSHLNSTVILDQIDLLKEVEGRRLLQQDMAPPTALACLALIEHVCPNLEGKEAVVIGRSDIVGKPAAWLLIGRQVTVTICNSKTKNLSERVSQADIIIATAGRPNLVKGNWIKQGAVVIDVGENIVNGKLVGDVEFETAKEVAGYITPVPGGVGPVTNVMLVKNLLFLHQWKEKL